jgi:hypothetical protein
MSGTATAIPSKMDKGFAAIQGFASKVGSKGMNFLKDNTFPGWVLLFFIGVIITCFVVWLKFRGAYETPQNVRDITATRLGSEGVMEIVGNSGARKGLEDYIATELSNPRINATDLQFTNFYFNTVRVAGCFLGTPGGSATEQESVFSVEALRLACQGGARAFVFDIWPSMDARGGFRPILQLVEEGSGWRKISMNTMEFETAVEAIVTQIYGSSMFSPDMSTMKDVTLFYLRFCGTPRPQTYKAVAAALAKHTQPYLLEPSFSSARRAESLVGTSLKDLQGKLVIFANQTNKTLESHPEFFSYVNMCAASDDTTASSKIEYTLEEFQNLTPTDRTTKISYIQNRITFLILPTYDERMFTNDWDWYTTAFAYGIHCIPMNMFNREKSGLYNHIFKTHSYFLKDTQVPPITPDTTIVVTTGLKRPLMQGFENPVSLRRNVVILPEPKIPADPGFQDGTLAVNADFQDGDRCAQIVRDIRKYAETIQTDVQTYMRETVKEDTRDSPVEVRKNNYYTKLKYIEDNINKMNKYIKTKSAAIREFKCDPNNYHDDVVVIDRTIKELVKGLDILKAVEPAVIELK